MNTRRRFALLVAAVPVAAAATTAEIYRSDLSGTSESPPTASAGSGLTVVTWHAADGMLRVQASFSGLTANTTASHIHCCIVAPATTAAVATQTPTFVDFPLGVTSGAYDHTFDLTQTSSFNSTFVNANGGTAAAAAAALLAGLAAGTAYLNIHSTTFPGGEIRGNLVRDTLFTNDFEQP
jgi:hypothetical protein